MKIIYAWLLSFCIVANLSGMEMTPVEHLEEIKMPAISFKTGIAIGAVCCIGLYLLSKTKSNIGIGFGINQTYTEKGDGNESDSD